MKEIKSIRKFFYKLNKTPLHPQWFVFKNEDEGLASIAQYAQGNVLDIGAGSEKIRKFLSSSCQYISLDYYETATNWYGTSPSVFGDAQTLPFYSASMDTILLLDVLEHLPNPESCLAEVSRVLLPGGKFILQVPFIYPIHDAPYDFRRWTLFGLRNLAKKYHYQIDIEKQLNHPLESAALLSNIALSKTVLNWIQSKNLFSILIIFLPFAILYNNLLAALLASVSKDDEMMPSAYCMVLSKIS